MSRRSRRPSRCPALHAAVSPLVERLETRRLLAINPIAVQPTGPLTGKIVYTSGGHGWTWSSTLNRWATDRGDNNEIVEDFGNQDQLTFYADYLLRAGATVVPMRPVGRQPNEVVLDNDSAGVTYSGAWSNSAGTRYYDEDYGTVADAVSYRFSSTNDASETATATYTPSIPQAGFYPVYTWVSHSANRTSQLYKINHTGGQMQMRVDHGMVGNGWVYLGSYHFNAGASAANGSVQISNHGPAGKVVIADAIRFGNGMGDVRNGPGGIGAASGTFSGHPREDENAQHWIYRSVGIGGPSSVWSIGNVSAPSDMAEHMNADTNPFGTSVYIGFHSNAGGGRGAVGLIDTDLTDRTPHQADLALYTGRQINQDMQALNGQFEHNWSTRTTHTFTGQFGEINLGADAEMDATIIEVAFHDSVEDAQLMRDPKVRDQLGRSTYEATLEYFDNWGGLTTPVTVPSAPVNVRAVSNAVGEVTLNWSAGPTGVHGAAATGYRVYVSTNGYGFDGGTFFAGGGTTGGTIPGLAFNVPHYFKVVAVNAGGESKGSEVLAALPSGGTKQVLIVNGFDRFDRGGNVRYPYAHVADGLTDRVFARLNNSFDYVVQVASAIEAAEPQTRVASTSNEAVINGSVNLTDYDTVVWILGEESTVNDTFNSTEQTKAEQFIAAGGNLFVTGAEIAWDLDQQNNGRTFYENSLKGNYVADDANSYSVSGVAGSIFNGLSFSFDNGAQFYNTDFPDVIAPMAGASAALNYGNGAGNAGIQVQGTGGRGSIVMFGFPFETITTAANRTAVMGRVLDFFGANDTGTVAGRIYQDFNDNGVQDAGEPGLPGMNVVLDTNNSNTLGAGDMAVVTNASGDYLFPAAPVGTFLLGVTSFPADLTRIGAISYNVNVTSGGSVTGRDFRYFPVRFVGGAAGEHYYVRLDPAATRIEISVGAVPLPTPTYSALKESIYELRFELGGGDDSLTVDYSNGKPTNGDIWFDGGADATSAGDLYRVIGTTINDSLSLFTGYAQFNSGGMTPGSWSHTGLPTAFERMQFDAGDGNDQLSYNYFNLPQPATTFNGAAGSNTVDILSGTYALDADAQLTNESLDVIVGGTLLVNATQHLGTLDVKSGGVVSMTPNGGRVLRTRGLVASGRLNLNDNDLILDYDPLDPTPLKTVQDRVASAMNGGSWDGPGIATEMPDALTGLTSLGIAEAAAVFGLDGAATETFSGESVDATTVLIKYTYAGDANLDGQISGDDYSAIDFNVQVPDADGWYNGDFNYDGIISGDDYSLIDFNIAAQGAPL